MATGLMVLSGLAPVCEPRKLEDCKELLFAEVNAQRLAAGLDRVQTHPVLEAIAGERARQIASGGSVEPSMRRLQATTRRLFRDGYNPHDWTQGELIGRWGAEVYGQWRDVKPDWYASVRAGDYEHVGIGIGRLGQQPVFTLILGLTKRTLEWRLAAPLEDLESVRDEMLLEVNRVRDARGRSALTRHPVLDNTAQRQAEDMLARAYYDHRSPEGGTVEDRVHDAGYRAKNVAENIAKGLFTPTEAVDRWMASSGHKKNILRPKLVEMGIGVAFGENANGFEVVWVQVFATPR